MNRKRERENEASVFTKSISRAVYMAEDQQEEFANHSNGIARYYLSTFAQESSD